MNPHTIKVACSNCNLRELCMPMDLTTEELDRIDAVVGARRKVKRGATLFRNGEKFTSLYAIRTGFFKTCLVAEDGRDQVTGFQMAGEVIGLDGIVNDRHACDAVALAEQGLVTVDAAGIQVTATGWYFVRAVALVFDRYLQTDRNRARFSRII